MKEDNEDPNIPEDDDDDLFDSDWDDDGDDETTGEDGGEEICPYTEMIISAILSGKPFGMNWTSDIMSDFLKKRGYRVITRHDNKSNKDYQVAVKPGDKVISGDGHSNLEKAFEEEVQLILSKWLLSL